MICQICRNKIGQDGRKNVSLIPRVAVCDHCIRDDDSLMRFVSEYEYRRTLPAKYQDCPHELKILLSIHPEHAANILWGKKKIEVRKDFPKLPRPFDVLMYVTGGVGVVGEFTCDQIFNLLDYPDAYAGHARIYRPALADTCLTYEGLIDYSNGKDLYGWHVTKPKIYDAPRPLREYLLPCEGSCHDCEMCGHSCVSLPTWAKVVGDLAGCLSEEYCCNYIKRPPQSWCYIRGRGKEINRDN